MNTAFYEETVTKSYVLISWDIGKPGFWFSIEPYLSRTQIKERSRILPEGLGCGHCITKYRPFSKSVNLNETYQYGSGIMRKDEC